VDNYLNWLRKLQDDLIEQFRGQPKIAIFQKAVARQLEELYAFYYQLYVLQWLDKAEGAQLDGIGNIVDLSRTDALIWANMAGLNVPMDDALYRMYLWFKIFLNTSEGTYADIVRTLEMFWPETSFFYSEYIDIPATMFFTSESLPLNTDLRILRIVTRVKAAGVALKFIMQVDAQETPMYFASTVSGYTEAIIVDNPDMGGTTTDYSAAGVSIYADGTVINNPEMDGEIVEYSGVGANIYEDVMVLDNPQLGGTTDTFAPAAANIYKEMEVSE